MPIHHTVRQGETVASIAADNGFRRVATIWTDDANRAIHDQRRNCNVLAPGDVVVIPDKDTSGVVCETAKRHTFVTSRLEQHFKVRCESPRGVPIAEKPYELTIDGALFTGITKPDGIIEHDIPVRARSGRLEVEGNVWMLDLGFLDPVDEPTDDEGRAGAQGRLKNLGYYFGRADGRPSDELTRALSAFERDEHLPVTGTGEVRPNTALRLRERHGC